MKTILTAIALIGLIGCVTKNYYLVYPVKVEQIETATAMSSGGFRTTHFELYTNDNRKHKH